VLAHPARGPRASGRPRPGRRRAPPLLGSGSGRCWRVGCGWWVVVGGWVPVGAVAVDEALVPDRSDEAQVVAGLELVAVPAQPRQVLDPGVVGQGPALVVIDVEQMAGPAALTPTTPRDVGALAEHHGEERVAQQPSHRGHGHRPDTGDLTRLLALHPAPVQGLGVDESHDLLLRAHRLAPRRRRRRRTGRGFRQQQVTDHVGRVGLHRLEPPRIPGVGEGPVDQRLQAGVHGRHLIPGQAQQQARHPVGLVPAAHAPVPVQAAGPLLPIPVSLGPLLGHPTAQIVQRLTSRRVQQLLFDLRRRQRTLGHLIRLLRRHRPRTHRRVGPGLAAQPLRRRQRPPGPTRARPGLASEILLRRTRPVALPHPGLLVARRHPQHRPACQAIQLGQRVEQP